MHPARPTLPPGTPAARARTAWRIALLAGAIVVETGTHWPKLTLGTPDQPVDKLLHASAFGMLTALVLQARVVGRRWMVLPLMLAWSAVDELTQGIPGLNRSVDLDDWIADAIGIVLALAFAAALAPQGRGLARLVEQRRRVAGMWLFSRPMPWLHVATGAVLGIAAGGPAAIWLDSLFVRKTAQPYQYGVVGGVLGAIGGAHLMLELGLRAGLRRNAERRSCLRCGRPAPDDAPADAPCTACGAARSAADWSPIAELPGSEEIRLCLAPVLHGVALLVLLTFLGIALLPVLRLRVPGLLAVDQSYNQSPVDFRILVDLAVLSLVGSWTLWRCRRRIARRVDEGRERCLGCGFDLRAASGATCPECGAPIHAGPPAWQRPADAQPYNPAP